MRAGRSAITAMLAAAAATVLVAACSSQSGTTGPTNTGAPPAVTLPATSAPAVPTTAATGLTGTWSGQYSGAYTGTFTVRWTQTGSQLSGTIKISSPPRTLPINGTVTGNNIRFGTLGSTAITYTGTVSGNSMSGNYQVQGAGGSSGGPWSANKTG